MRSTAQQQFVLKFFLQSTVSTKFHILVGVEVLCPSCAQLLTAVAHTLIRLTEVSSPPGSVPAPCLAPANSVDAVSTHLPTHCNSKLTHTFTLNSAK